jgi:EAL domain-containing protein (putative c-di-GMP-specific phosphodiesterase class I)
MALELSQLNGPASCGACRNGAGFGFELTMAFQPIVDVVNRTVYAYEALVRGVGGASAAQVLALVTDENRYAFDQSCRVKAIQLAAQLGIADHGAKLSMNFMPGAVYSPAACIRRTLETAKETKFPLSAIIFEIMENERVADSGHLHRIVEEYQKHSFTLALDDFGAGYSGLNLLAELEGVRIVKLDGKLIRGIDRNRRAEQVVASPAAMCRELGIIVIGECIETSAECAVLLDCGVELMQGYLFAKPAVEALPEINWAGLPELRSPSVEFNSPASRETVATFA